MTEAPKFGPGIIGQEEYDRQVRELKETSGRFGPALRRPERINIPAVGTGKDKPTPPPDTIPEEPTLPPVNALSVKKLREVLEADPGQAAAVLEDELGRAEGPRKSALREIAKAERIREGGDQGLIDRVEYHLETLE
jgi:hypothetical protein